MRKVQLTIKQEEVAPATTSDLVVMNNGKTLKEELSTNVLDKFSREVTVDTSMSKVIDGTLDGVYESGVMYGRSLVNLAISLNREVPCTFTKKNLSSRCLLASCMSLTADKTYVAIVELGNMFLDNLTSMDFMLQINPSGGSSYSVRSNGHTSGNKKIYIKFNARYDSTAGIEFKGVATQWEDNADGSPTLDVKNYMVLEYQQGMENWDIPFFTGLCDVKMPILHNVGKNLFDINGDINQKFSYMAGGSGNVILGANSFRADSYSYDHHGKGVILNLKPNTTYTISGYVENRGNVNFMTGEWNPRHRVVKANGYFETTYTPADNEVETCISFVTFSTSSDAKAIFSNIQLEEGSTATSYEPYKSNILRTPETVTLRSLPNGVRDELNLKTGEYIKRIGEIVLNGSEGWASHSTGTVNGTTAYRYRTNVSNMLITNQLGETPQIFCDKLPCVRDTQEEIWSTVPSILRRIASDYGAIYIVTSASTVNAFKQWLSQNPITVQYELAEPITTIVEPLTIPFAYENGHIILESGSEEQSLLPELKYSVPASKNGVISTTSKAILKHEQHLHKFEDLLLRESILMDYRLTLSFLDKM